MSRSRPLRRPGATWEAIAAPAGSERVDGQVQPTSASRPLQDLLLYSPTASTSPGFRTNPLEISDAERNLFAALFGQLIDRILDEPDE